MSDLSIKDICAGLDNPFAEKILSGPAFTTQWDGVSYIDFQGRLAIKRSRLDSTETQRRLSVTLVYPSSGVESDVEYSYFPGAKVLEVSGRIANRGQETINNMDGPFSLAIKAGYPGMGTPRMTTIYGGADTSSAFPPKAYSVNSVDGVRSLVGGREFGRSTETEMPYIILTDEKEEHGIFCALEWPCRWIISCAKIGEWDAVGILGHVAYTAFQLRPGESVYLPRASVGFFDGGGAAGGNALRRHVADNVIKSVGGTKLPPVFFNTWYAYGNALNIDTLRRDAELYAELGVEYFVIDAGWFKGGFRDGIGNWEHERTEVFPEGMSAFADYVRSLGMKFGSWLEIEFAMKESDWGKRHPEWFYHPGRHRGLTKRFADGLLKLDDADVRREVLRFLCSWVEKYGIEWLRWDFNNTPAPFWDNNEEEEDFGKLQLKYGEGLYALLDAFRGKCPQVHIEACAGGGHRMDLGTLRRANSAWMNDLAERVPSVRRFQACLNQFLPGNYCNSAQMLQHEEGIGSCLLSLRSKMAGSLGFSTPSEKITAELKEALKREIANYKSIRHLLMKDYYPLFNPASVREYDGWQFHDPEKEEGFLMVFRNGAAQSEVSVKLPGLTKGVEYELTDVDDAGTTIWRGGAAATVSVPVENHVAWLRYRMSKRKAL